MTRRCRADQMFHRETLSGDWSIDTMDGRMRSLDGNKYAQVSSKKAYFTKIYLMDNKSNCGYTLKLFCQEFGVPERLTFERFKGLRRGHNL